MARAECEASVCQRLGGEQLFFSNEEVGHLPADFKDWKAHVSITATAVVKKETKVDPKKPQEKVHYASLCVLNEDGKKGTAFHVIWVSSVTLQFCSNGKRELQHEQLHERFAAYERSEEINFPLTLDSDEAIKNLGFDPTGAADS